MDINKYIAALPNHWKIIPANEADGFFDDGRDYDKPMFIRNDELARIYFNEGETEDSGYLFAIAWDEDGDGDCYGDFESAIKAADQYVEKHHHR